MTSFTSSESKQTRPNSYRPKEQMAHLQIVAAEKGPLPRTLRLAGSVAYNALKPRPCSRQLAARFTKFWWLPANSCRPVSLF